jgi:adenosine deaminase
VRGLGTQVRFCPELHCAEGLSPDDAVGAVVAGVRRGCARCGGGGGGGGSIRGGVIVCALRSFPAQHSLAMATLAQRWLGRGVVAFDVAGDEHWPLRLHAAALEFCRAQHVPMTVHAGEVMDVTEPGAMLPNLALALECGAQRIGHGFALCQDESGQLVKQAAAAGVTVEVCLPICLNPRFSWYPISAACTRCSPASGLTRRFFRGRGDHQC